MAFYHTDPTVRDFVERGQLFVPEADKPRILDVYGERSLTSFHDFNIKMGSKYDDPVNTMTHWMNVTEGHLQDQFDKLSGELADIFNILQSFIRTRIGEEVWYVDQIVEDS
jgi:predicted nuclease of restriction endonuclease-like (RecB) superfamily